MKTAWDYCKKCKQFDEDGTGICSGTPFNYEIANDVPPCSSFEPKTGEIDNG